jgi:hypothetical protein
VSLPGRLREDGQLAQPLDVARAKHRGHARDLRGGHEVGPHQAGMSVRAPEHRQVQQAGKDQVAHVGALPPEQPRVLRPAHRPPDQTACPPGCHAVATFGENRAGAPERVEPLAALGHAPAMKCCTAAEGIIALMTRHGRRSGPAHRRSDRVSRAVALDAAAEQRALS